MKPHCAGPSGLYKKGWHNIENIIIDTHMGMWPGHIPATAPTVIRTLDRLQNLLQIDVSPKNIVIGFNKDNGWIRSLHATGGNALEQIRVWSGKWKRISGWVYFIFCISGAYVSSKSREGTYRSVDGNWTHATPRERLLLPIQSAQQRRLHVQVLRFQAPLRMLKPGKFARNHRNRWGAGLNWQSEFCEEFS